MFNIFKYKGYLEIVIQLILFNFQIPPQFLVQKKK